MKMQNSVFDDLKYKVYNNYCRNVTTRAKHKITRYFKCYAILYVFSSETFANELINRFQQFDAT